MGQVLPMTAACCALLALMLGLVGVVQELHAGMAATRRAAARAAAREAAAEGSACSLCMERPQGVVFGCGHQVQQNSCLLHRTICQEVRNKGHSPVGTHREGADCRLCFPQVCADCSRERCPQDCPFCREPIVTRINLFRS